MLKEVFGGIIKRILERIWISYKNRKRIYRKGIFEKKSEANMKVIPLELGRRSLRNYWSTCSEETLRIFSYKSLGGMAWRILEEIFSGMLDGINEEFF